MSIGTTLAPIALAQIEAFGTTVIYTANTITASTAGSGESTPSATVMSPNPKGIIEAHKKPQRGNERKIDLDIYMAGSLFTTAPTNADTITLQSNKMTIEEIETIWADDVVVLYKFGVAL